VSLGQLHTPREEFTHVTPPLSDDPVPAPASVGGR
jgi:NADH dehydrogenase